MNFRVTLPRINNTGRHAIFAGNDQLTLTNAPMRKSLQIRGLSPLESVARGGREPD